MDEVEKMINLIRDGGDVQAVHVAMAQLMATSERGKFDYKRRFEEKTKEFEALLTRLVVSREEIARLNGLVRSCLPPIQHNIHW
jgi:tRNA C32,U32 (ribose-2'-O)-methylase TrmJ